MKKFLTILAAIVLLSESVACAEIKTYTGFSEHFMTAEETVDSAKCRAELEAQRDALEQVCFQVKAHSEKINSELTDDEIITISAGILHVTDTKFSTATDVLGIIVKATVTVDIDTDELETLLDREIRRRRKDKS